MHIHPSSPNSATLSQSEESAAIKIQAGFRGYRVRKQILQQQRPSINGYHQIRTSLHRRRHHQHRHQHRQQQQQQQQQNSHQHQIMEQQNNSIGSGSGTGQSASSQLRDDHSSGSEGSSVEDRCATKIQAGVRGFLVRKKQKIESDAATKIQAGFRGFKARKEAQKLKQK